MHFLIANFDVDETNDFRDKPQQQLLKDRGPKEKKRYPKPIMTSTTECGFESTPNFTVKKSKPLKLVLKKQAR